MELYKDGALRENVVLRDRLQPRGLEQKVGKQRVHRGPQMPR